MTMNTPGSHTPRIEARAHSALYRQIARSCAGSMLLLHSVVVSIRLHLTHGEGEARWPTHRQSITCYARRYTPTMCPASWQWRPPIRASYTKALSARANLGKTQP